MGLTGYVLIGTVAVLIPAVMPSITDEFSAAGLSLAAIGLIFPARSIGGILGNLLAGVGSDKLGRQRMVWLAALLVSVALGLTAWARPWLLFLAALAAVNLTQAALSTGINALVADANRESRARALNTLHGVYGAGAALSPLLIGYLLEGGLLWRWAIAGAGVLWLLYGVLFWLLAGNGHDGQTGARTQKLDWAMLRDGPFLALFFIAFAYNGVAYSLLGWIAIFMQRSAGFSILASVSMISVFYVALTVGRFLCAAFSEQIGYARTLLLLGIGITLTYPLVIFGSTWLVVTGVFLTGLSLSGLFPTSLAYGARHYDAQTGALTGTLNVAMTLGAMIPPLWTGIIADAWSFQGALGVNYVLVAPLVLVAIYLRKIEANLS